VREVRFIKNADGSPDGGVHDLYTITGRDDAPGCSMSQPDFATAGANKNAIFRIPTPVFGAGLMELIPDAPSWPTRPPMRRSAERLEFAGGRTSFSRAVRFRGQPNNNGNDGTIARFGWKSQNKSLLLFSGEAYNVEMGITNELFQTERAEQANCQYAMAPNDITDSESTETVGTISAIEKFSIFMRFLAPPTPSADTPGGALSISRGQQLFSAVGCAACHTPMMQTGNSTVTALRYKPVNLYSDLMLHDMGPDWRTAYRKGRLARAISARHRCGV
jgi:CxxC motif-containing protein (DUF1111 family)